jgi:hypothetical protein
MSALEKYAAKRKLAKKLKEMTDRELLAESTRANKSSKKRKRLAQGLLIAGVPLATILAGRFGTKAMAAAGGGTLAAGLATAASSGKKKRRSRKAFSHYLSSQFGQMPELDITSVRIKPKEGPIRSYKGSKLKDWLAQQKKQNLAKGEKR